MRASQAHQMSPTVQPSLTAAIAKGVPIFNSGNAQGCATIYRDALSQLVKTGALGQGTWAERLVRHALTKSGKQAPSPAAWTLRRAMDSLLLSLAK